MSERPLASKRIRKNFGKIRKIIEIPDLIGMQRESYSRFLQMDVPPEKRKDIGLQAVFNSVFPIKDFTGSASLEFVSYRFAEVKHSEEECIYRGMTYELPVRITVRLVVYDIDKETGVSNIRDIKEQEIYFGTIPLMTEKGTFIINGTERVVVSQLHRSSGVFFDHDKGKTHSSGKVIYTSRIIPVRGSWIDMEIDPKDIVHIRIDRRRKFPVTLLFKAFGYTTEDLLNYFYKTEKIIVRGESIFKEFKEDFLKGQRASRDVKDPETGDVIVKKGRMFTQRAIRQLKSANVEMIPINVEEIINKAFANEIVHPENGEPIVKSNDLVDDEVLSRLSEAGITEFELLFIDAVSSSDSIRKTLLLDKVETKEEALVEIYRRLRPGNPATPEVAQDFIDHLFFKSSYYDLSGVGRMKINIRLGIDTPVNVRTLRKEDILLTAKTLVELRDTQGVVDDIDHLGNRRVRAVGELLENQYRIGLVRMERAIKERMSLQEVDALMPHDLVNPKPVSAVIKEFFGTSQLSQFMDQTNPLSETTHKRRLSALGPGGLTRERAGFEVRDVHPSHYGRICPIETPEGPNIGLIVSLGTYARVNDFGFIETPYSVVKDATVTDDVRFLSAFEEKEHPIAQANAPVDDKGEYVNPVVTSRVAGEFMMVKSEDIEMMDVSPNQLVSVSASLIPFLENDDANRALMGSNMQRQAVPLIVNEAPLVGTGIEGVVAKDSGVAIVAQRDGVVVDVDGSRIVLKHDSVGFEKPVTIYNLSKFIRSNQNTCFNHRPIVRKGQRVKAGEIIADGPSTDKGELALGKNVTVAFMPWGGYNFEDSILVSERLVRDGVYTSVHIEEFEVLARDTKLGKEEITRDIPNVGEEALRNLDESGIIRLGAEVGQGDILVGKITPKGETLLSPEEKLLRAIFGEKAGDVKDTSLRVPPGVEGIVTDAKVFSRRGIEKDDRTRFIEDEEIARLEEDRDDELSVIEATVRSRLEKLLVGQKCHAPLKKDKKVLIPKGGEIDSEVLADIPVAQLEGIVLEDSELTEQVHDILERYRDQCELCRMAFEQKVSRYEKGDDLPPGVIKLVKIYVAMKRKLSVGDKMAGRHGNKGVVSRILPQEDLPYFEDGTPVDMVLNPLGVPSRMNVGQILEIHLGRAAKGLGDQLNRLLEERKYEALREKMKRIFSVSSVKEMIDGCDDKELCDFVGNYKDGVHMATPVFDGAKEDEIKALLDEAGLFTSGQTTLYDGRTGEPFNEKITVGTMYMLKLHHLVDDKIHARSIGPYSLVTQQPLGGKAQFGGQRLGEMEVWAMEAYGAAHALQEFLTVKSDDMAGRTRMYEKIVKGQNLLEPGIPESFRVLTKELQSLGLDVTLMEDKKLRD
jgi:DNA-directed RNA polymerase subunit beta